VPDHQLSLAIGREGQNARLAARLTGVRVDIRSETQVAEGVPAGGVVDDVEYAEGEWVTNAETGDMEWHAADGSVISQAEWAAQSDSDTAPAESDTAPAESDTAPAESDTAPAEDAGDDATPVVEAEAADDDAEPAAVVEAADGDAEPAVETEVAGEEPEPAAETKGAGDDD
jgi:N utilization substance protein A